MTRRGLVVVFSLVVIGCTATPKRQPSSTGGDTGEDGGSGGGSSTGGKTGTGGAPSTGGAPGTGGAPSTGGAPGTGGTTDTGGSGGSDAGAGQDAASKDAAGDVAAKDSAGDKGGGGGASGTSVLLVTAPTPTAGDTALKTKLTSMGLTVVMAADSEPAAAANGKALVVITSSGGRAVVADKFKATAVPVIVMKSGVMASMSMTTAASPGMDTETDPDQTDIAIVDAASPLAAGFPAGNVKVYTAMSRIVAGAPAAAAKKVATVVAMPALVAIFSYEANDTMTGGFKAPARRVGFFIHQTATLSADGLKLFEAAVNWARQ